MNPDKTVNHHKKYQEIHGVDEVVPMQFNEHQKLHRRLRREGKCNIPSGELAKISSKANARIKKATIDKTPKEQRTDKTNNGLGKFYVGKTGVTIHIEKNVALALIDKFQHKDRLKVKFDEVTGEIKIKLFE